MDIHSLTLQLLVPSLDLLAVARYTLTSAYFVCFYDWVISLDEEVIFVFSAPWNIVKAAYLFCRYYPLAIAPFHFWGFLGDHEQHVCESYFHALSACTIPPIFAAQRKHDYLHVVYKPLFTLVSVVSSVLLMLRTYAFSGKKKWILAVLSITFSALVGYMIWVSWTQIILSPLFLFAERTGCFGITDLPIIKIVQVASGTPGISSVLSPFAYHLGIVFVRRHCHLLSPSLTLLLGTHVLVRWPQHVRDDLALLSRASYPRPACPEYPETRQAMICIIGVICHFDSVLVTGIFIYIFMTILNMLTFGTFFSSRVLYQARAVGPWYAYILPSVLSCRLVLMLRREASPTETQLRSRYSHIVNEALEMIAVESHPEETSKETALSVSRGAQAQS
ncbi:hypothetical protein EDB86DRAFT_3102983 [Lactarius hatsudake]|nr:hypothetical protein EDB86DRAFT_3102983 [Lactarius hatsudake]